MFPSTSSRETLRLSGKQNSLFPSGAHIKCILSNSHNNHAHFFTLLISTLEKLLKFLCVGGGGYPNLYIHVEAAKPVKAEI